MPVLINPQTGVAEDLQGDAASAAVSSGYHVPLVDPDGNAVSAPLEDARSLVASGKYSQPKPEELQTILDAGKYSSAGQQAATFVEGALSPLTLGTSNKITSSLGITTPEAQQKRKQFNPATHTVGELVGLTSGLLLAPESSVPGLLAKSGPAVSEAIGATGLGAKALSGAIEGAAFAAPRAVDETLMGNPSDVGENLIADIGLSAALGAGFNLALAPLEALAKSPAAKNKARLATTMADSAAAAPPVASSLEAALPTMGLSDAEKKGVIEGLKKIKSNAAEIDKAGQYFGAPVLEEMRSDSKFIQDMGSALSKRTSATGIGRQQAYSEGFDKVTSGVEKILGSESQMTKMEAGQQLKQGIINKLEMEYEPIRNIYNSIKETGQNVELDPSLVKSASEDLMSIEGLLSSKGKPLSTASPSYQLAKRVSEDIPELGTIDDIRRYAQQIKQDTAGRPDLRFVSSQIINRLDDLEEKSVINFAKQSLPPEAKQQVESLIENHAAAKAGYAQLKEKMGDIGAVIGKKLRKGEGVTAFIDWLENTPPEKVAGRLFTKNNVGFLSFLKKEFPQEAEILSSLKKAEFRDAAYSGGKLSPGAALKKIDQLEPEVKKFLFSKEELEGLKHAQTWLDAVPKNVNPSGTANTIEMLNWLQNPVSAVVGQTADFAKKKFIQQMTKVAPETEAQIGAMFHVKQMALKTEKAIESESSKIFSKLKPDLPAVAGSTVSGLVSERPKDDKLDKISEKVIEYQFNPEKYMNKLSSDLAPIAPHMPQLTAAVSNSMGRAVSFLAQKVPSKETLSPLDSEMPIPKPEISKFNRYAMVADKPLSTLGLLKDGMLLPQDIETLQAVHPALYRQMKSSVLERLTQVMAQKKGYLLPVSTRQSLSLFLGMNLDSSVVPLVINQNQQALSVTALQSQQEQNKLMNARPSKSGMERMKSPESDQTRYQQAAMRRENK